MSKIFITVILCSVFRMVAAQTHVSNIRVQVSEEQLIITYDLTERADIEVHVSFDGGINFRGPLQYVSGAAGRNIAPERDKIVVWNVVREFGDVDYPNAVVKIVANVINDNAEQRKTGLKSGQKRILEAGYNVGFDKNAADRFTMNFITGTQLSPYFSWGVGIGWRRYSAHGYSHSTSFIPIFADFRVNLLDRKVSPYLSLGTGHSIGIFSFKEMGGFFFNPALGISFLLPNKYSSAINVGAGYEMQRINFRYDLGGSYVRHFSAFNFVISISY